jgi:hypothetical protein
MSWSINFIGKPENVAAALVEQSAKMDGQSKVEYDAALPHFVALVKENFGPNPPFVKLAASGHGFETNKEGRYRQCSVTLEFIHGTLV